MSGQRRRYNVGCVKLRAHQRTISHDIVGTTDESWAQRGYLDVIGSDSDGPGELARFPYGAEVVYSLELTDAEAEQFAAASNLRYLEETQWHKPLRYVARPTGTAPVPTLATLSWLRARQVDLRRWHGRDVRVAVLDQGTTKVVRDAMGFTLIARTVTSGVTLGSSQELIDPDNHHHGCLVAPNAVPAGGLLLDAIICNSSGSSNDTWEAAGIRWAVDNGAKVINLSFGGGPGVPSQAFQDACAYARDNGEAQIVISAGNDDLADLAVPSSASRLFSGVHSAIAFDESTDRRALFSNHASDASGCSTGVDVDSFDIYGYPVRWNGTSAAAPHMAQLLARALTGAQFTPVQVGAAFKANTRDTGAGAIEQGGGAYDLRRALTALGVGPTAAAGVTTPAHLDSRGGATTPAAWSITPASGVAVDDVQLIVLVSSVDAPIVVPPGWTMLTDAAYYGGWEASRNIPVGPTRVRVLAAPYTAAQPASLSLSFGGGTWFSALAIITVRCPGGMDPERFAPLVQFGTGGSITALSAVPASSNDLQLCVFAQRHPTATTGSLSLPTGLTQQGFWRPSSGTTGYTLLVATSQLASAAATPSYTSTSNDATGTWAALTLTVPGGAVPSTPITQVESAGPAGAAALFLPSNGSGSVVSGGSGGGSSVTTATVTYPASTVIIPNPERGWYYFAEEAHYLANNTGFVQLTQAELTTARTTNAYSLVFKYYVIEKYRAQDTIDQAYLDLLATDFNRIRAAGCKAIIIFSYNNNEPTGPPYNAEPAPARVFSHFDQLAPTLNAHADVIDSLQVGFIGVWGEWYYSDNFGDEGVLTTAQWNDRKTLLRKQYDQLDPRIFLQIRYTGVHHRWFTEDTTRNPARAGFYNAAFGASDNDMGTWGEYTTQSLSAMQAYMESTTALGVPMALESNENNPPRSTWDGGLAADLARYHGSAWNPQGWAGNTVIADLTQAQRDEAARRLGYRLRLTTATLPATAPVNATLPITLTITNDGFARTYRQRPVQIVMVNGAATVTRTLAYDIRNVLPGQTVTISENITGPPSTGSWALHLVLPDPSASIAARPEYAIQLANTGVWDATTGRNSLLQTLTVS